MSETILELDRVTTVFRTGWGRGRSELVAMREVSLDVRAGETLGLVGESGSGKSTTASVALGLREPTSGTVRFLGEPIGGPKQRRARRGLIQTVPQNPHWSLDPRMPVGLSVAEPLAALDGSRLTAHAERVAELLRQVRLDPALAARFPHELSGGQRQRIAIARALVTNPRFIVFDEAVSALDVSVQAQILNLIIDLQAQHGFGALFISHDLAAVRYLAHRIAVMRLGEIVELADTARFYETPEHEYSRQLLEAL
ncbi:ATP-binding cassette domain-containing protein [Agromyces soli]|uniref:ATP-binding cassette domain-containing protein n=1 Tax=Agromyces soli TaxID=659012 RepID=A0ABY4ATV5_9MICO|nr:ATP-binding cassette domain-containing protein [Agromyces soli]UOE26591.1 ATP-binding cassette domain-containing protein [Agromyces soli]